MARRSPCHVFVKSALAAIAIAVGATLAVPPLIAFAPDVTELLVDDNGRLRIADLPAGSVDECGICDFCMPPGSSEMGHIAIATPAGAASRGDGWHINEECLPGDCDLHPIVSECLEGTAHEYFQLPELAALWSEIRDGTVDGSELAARYPRNVEWNSQRHALQVFDCGGGLIAHVPVRATQ